LLEALEQGAAEPGALVFAIDPEPGEQDRRYRPVCGWPLSARAVASSGATCAAASA
jgi:hypothetical protein